jgi:predicted CoA-binding protein
LSEIHGLPVAKRLADIGHEIHTLTLYVGAKHLPPLIQDIVRLGPRRVIFNPGTENPGSLGP